MQILVNGVWVDDTSGVGETMDAQPISTSQILYDANPVMTQIAALPTAQQSEIAFLNGLDVNNTEAATAFARWNGDNPATYGAAGSAKKWGAGTPLTTGGTVSYYFDPGSNWSTAEKAAYTSSVTLWSDEVNISFTLAPDAASASAVFYRYGTASYDTATWGAQETGAYENDLTTGSTVVGSTAVASMTKALISMQTTGSWSDLASFTVNGGYGIGTLVHEEGHLLGLGHGGPYNGNVVPATQQFNQYDTYPYSIMSYVEATDTSAAYYAQYPITGTNYGATLAPLTPQIDDILALQQFYGGPTSGALTTTETFGFNCTITDAAKSFFDFTVDTNPVVTLYDTALGNTLDLSAWSMASTINLNPGTFSSADGMVNNISIAYGTKIDTFVGGTGDDTITINSDNDTIDGGAGANKVVLSGNLNTWTLNKSAGIVTAGNGSVTDTIKNAATLQFADQTINTSNIPCFAAGTGLLTAAGAVAVEQLRPGDVMPTLLGHGPARVIWTGWRDVDCRAHPRPEEVMPVRVRAGAFAADMPACDVLLSPEHAVHRSGRLIPIRCLVNGATILQEDTDRVTYWHVELDRHDVMSAAGLPVESFLAVGNRRGFANGGDVIDLFPDFAADTGAARSGAARSGAAGSCVPRAHDGAVVQAVRADLLARLPLFGHATTDDPDLHVFAGGTELVPDIDGTVWRIDLPHTARRVHLISRSARPRDLNAWNEDGRTLGVAVAEIRLDGKMIPRDDARLRCGWHDDETSLRWTDGDATVETAAARHLELRLLPCLSYHQPETAAPRRVAM